MCFMKEGKSDQATRCIKSRIMTKVIDSVLSIDTFEQKCVVLKGTLKSPWLKGHVQTIVIDRYFSYNTIYEQKCLENITKLYKQSGYCDDYQQFKDILEATMVSTTGKITNNSTISSSTSTPVKKPSARKLLCMFTNILEVKKKLLTVKLELLNLSARQLNLEIHHGRWNKS